MGGARPMTWSRAVSLGALIAVLLGIATGLSHVGHTPVSTCTGTWRVVVGHPVDRPSTATENARAASLVPPPCAASVADPKGGFEAFALFNTEEEAQTYLRQLVAAGYVKRWGFEPYVEQAPQNPTP